MKVAFCLGLWGPSCCLEAAGAANTGMKEGCFCGLTVFMCINKYIYIYKYSNGSKSNSDYSDLKFFCVYPPETGSLASLSKYGLEMEGYDVLCCSYSNPGLLNSS